MAIFFTDPTSNYSLFFILRLLKFSSYAELLSKKITRGGIDSFLNVPEIQLWNSSLLLTAVEKLFLKSLFLINTTFDKEKPIKTGDISPVLIGFSLSKVALIRNKDFKKSFSTAVRRREEFHNCISGTLRNESIPPRVIFFESNSA